MTIPFANLVIAGTPEEDRKPPIPFWSTTAEGPLYSDDPWDVVFIGGEKLPGICSVKTGSVAQVAIDKGKAKGVNGAVLTVTGYDPGKFEIRCEVATSDQWAELQRIIRNLWRRPKAVARVDAGIAVQVHHPALQLLNIQEAVIFGVTLPEDGSDPGFKAVRFLMQESVLPTMKPAVKTAKSAAPGVVPVFKKGEEPQNATPAKPSTNHANMSSRGQPAKPEGGVS